VRGVKFNNGCLRGEFLRESKIRVKMKGGKCRGVLHFLQGIFPMTAKIAAESGPLLLPPQAVKAMIRDGNPAFLCNAGGDR